MTTTTRPTFTASAPGFRPVTTRRKGHGAKQIAAQHFKGAFTLADMRADAHGPLTYVFTNGSDQFTVQEVSASPPISTTHPPQMGQRKEADE